MISAWAGAVTHRLWDDVTHDGPAGTSLGFAMLGRPVVPVISWWVALHTASMLIGFQPEQPKRPAEHPTDRHEMPRSTRAYVVELSGFTDALGRYSARG
ncbi:hypothetical protein [Streptomyces sp. NBC_01794]|uniref:hypothetical protein n=1 Tax=Streptomyces sp. NBC_01794 TaxID=2975942 RepID=UPI00387399D5